MQTAVQFNKKTNFHLHLVKSEYSRTSVSDLLLNQAISDFKKAAFEYIEAESKQPGKLEDATLGVVMTFSRLQEVIGICLGKNSEYTESEQEQLAHHLRSEIIPTLISSNLAERIYTKPRGYAGDFQTIQDMYNGTPKGNSGLGRLIDQMIMTNPACTAVQNRRILLSKVIKETVTEQNGKPTRITSFASGPAREIFDVAEQLTEDDVVKANLIDIDIEALAFVNSLREKSNSKLNIKLHNENLIYLSNGRRQLNLMPQHLIYSIGLIDYFEDKLVIKLLDYAYDLLEKGGQIVLGNFHDTNPIKPAMDHLLQWKLIHRTEEDMNRLFSQSKFEKSCDRFEYEDEGINMFAFCSKE